MRLVASAVCKGMWLLQSLCDDYGKCVLHNCSWCSQVVRAGKACAVDRCSRRAAYNYEGESPLYCRDHKDADMVLPSEVWPEESWLLEALCLFSDSHICM